PPPGDGRGTRLSMMAGGHLPALVVLAGTGDQGDRAAIRAGRGQALAGVGADQVIVLGAHVLEPEPLAGAVGAGALPDLGVARLSIDALPAAGVHQVEQAASVILEVERLAVAVEAAPLIQGIPLGVPAAGHLEAASG